MLGCTFEVEDDLSEEADAWLTRDFLDVAVDRVNVEIELEGWNETEGHYYPVWPAFLYHTFFYRIELKAIICPHDVLIDIQFNAPRTRDAIA